MLMRVIVRFWYDDREQQPGDEFEVADTAVRQWCATGRVEPADGEWPDGLCIGDVVQPAEVQPKAPQGKRSATTCPCEPGERPAKRKGGALSNCPVVGCYCVTWSGRCRAHRRTRADGVQYRKEHKSGGPLDE